MGNKTENASRNYLQSHSRQQFHSKISQIQILKNIEHLDSNFKREDEIPRSPDRNFREDFPSNFYP